jgi:cell division protease FtsH
VLLGGRSAEEIALGEISTGAQNDLQRVTDIARSMVTEWGMSERLGAVNFDARRGRSFLDTQQGAERGLHSEETARAIDDEVKMIVTEAHNEARRILLERRDVLETVTRRLLENEVMEGDELRHILEGHHVPHAPPDDGAEPAASVVQPTTPRQVSGSTRG